eukprot:8009384-Alexandrium_andersonii.AAC.1
MRPSCNSAALLRPPASAPVSGPGSPWALTAHSPRSRSRPRSCATRGSSGCSGPTRTTSRARPPRWCRAISGSPRAFRSTRR